MTMVERRVRCAFPLSVEKTLSIPPTEGALVVKPAVEVVNAEAVAMAAAAKKRNFILAPLVVIVWIITM